MKTEKQSRNSIVDETDDMFGVYCSGIFDTTETVVVFKCAERA